MPKTKKALPILSALISTLAFSGAAHADSAEDANKSNNPLNLAPSFNIHNYYTPKLFGTHAHTNDFLLRPTVPFAPNSVIGVPQIVRATIPVSTRPDPQGGYTTGAGDVNLFDIFLVKETGIQLGVGPLLTIPTASSDELGTGKWQAGLAAVAIDSSPKRVLGALVQWETSFAGDSDRENLNSVTFQPFATVNLQKGWYIRSTGIWTFDVKNDHYYIPVGLGLGKAWKTSGGKILNMFVEPQYTVAHDGDGLPRFTVFAGINMTFGK